MSYSTKEGYEIYLFYLALKRHFNSDYDFFKFKGKIKASQASYEKRSDIAFFNKLSKQSNPKHRVLSYLVHDSTTWIGDMLNHDEIYYAWKRRNNSLIRTIESDLNKYDSVKDLVKVSTGSNPKAISEYIAGRISPETLSCIDKATNIFSWWDTKVSDTIIYPDLIFKLRKYEPFLKPDIKKVRNLLTIS